MKRIISVLTVMAIMAAMLAVTAAPAFAEAKRGVANCVGVLASEAVPTTKGQEIVIPGAIHSKGALGEFVNSLAREAVPRGDRPCSLG